MLDYEFRWNDWNLDKIAKHGVSVQEAEYIVRNAHRPFPEKIDDGKVLVQGQTSAGVYLQVIYVPQENDEIFIIHARPLKEVEKRRLRRRRR
jgi:uncharacterized DUF497 family protein